MRMQMFPNQFSLQTRCIRGSSQIGTLRYWQEWRYLSGRGLNWDSSCRCAWLLELCFGIHDLACWALFSTANGSNESIGLLMSLSVTDAVVKVRTKWPKDGKVQGRMRSLTKKLMLPVGDADSDCCQVQRTVSSKYFTSMKYSRFGIS
jgi:hypothetical protein